MTATRIITLDDLRRDKIAGSFHIAERRDGSVGGFQFICPCGCGNESWLPVDREIGMGGWRWDGNREKPTLTPSVFNTGMPCKWHGWLRAGEWVPA